ncbi:hypothetical protein JavanS725_0017 [Streptococcus satellite phage Javan725]|nr:hypothetical protein JavanS725_0017 [Streptococcus satellite phage Javan725]
MNIFHQSLKIQKAKAYHLRMIRFWLGFTFKNSKVQDFILEIKY